MKTWVTSLGEDSRTFYSSLRSEMPPGPKRGLVMLEVLVLESSAAISIGSVRSRTRGSGSLTSSLLGKALSVLSVTRGRSRVQARRWVCPKHQVFRGVCGFGKGEVLL
jgi:hypothetical protein